MFGILISALNTLLGFVFRSLIIKFRRILALYFVVQGFVEILVELLARFKQSLIAVCQFIRRILVLH
ncbi:phage-related membrane protein [Escherichia coli]|nr:phage-related membrane protein [Escherichia coli]